MKKGVFILIFLFFLGFILYSNPSGEPLFAIKRPFIRTIITTTIQPTQIEYWNNIPFIAHNRVSFISSGSGITLRNVFISDSGVLKTGSMLPTIYGGNKYLYTPYRYYRQPQKGRCPDINSGNIIVYNIKYQNINAIHRVIDNSLNNGQVKVRGDNLAITEFVSCEDIKYLVVGVLYT